MSAHRVPFPCIDDETGRPNGRTVSAGHETWRGERVVVLTTSDPQSVEWGGRACLTEGDARLLAYALVGAAYCGICGKWADHDTLAHHCEACGGRGPHLCAVHKPADAAPSPEEMPTPDRAALIMRGALLPHAVPDDALGRAALVLRTAWGKGAASERASAAAREQELAAEVERLSDLLASEQRMGVEARSEVERLRAEKDAAVLAEREECAQIVANMAPAQVLFDITSAIRARK